MRKTKREMKECYALRYTEQEKKLKASIQMTRVDSQELNMHFWCHYPQLSRPLFIKWLHSHKCSLCASFESHYPAPLLYVQFEIWHLQLPAFLKFHMHSEHAIKYTYTAKYCCGARVTRITNDVY